MKKKIAVAGIIAVLVIAFVLCVDFNSYEPGTKTLDCENRGLIFSITTFDGKTEKKPFVECLGHSWCSLENQSGHSVFLAGNELINGEVMTFSVWAISDHFGVVFNLEPEFIIQSGRYSGRRSIFMNIDEAQLETIESYIEKNDRWTPRRNCSFWSIGLWNELCGDSFEIKTQTVIFTPTRLERSLDEYDSVEVNKDFSGVEGAFFYRDGKKTELELVS